MVAARIANSLAPKTAGASSETEIEADIFTKSWMSGPRDDPYLYIRELAAILLPQKLT